MCNNRIVKRQEDIKMTEEMIYTLKRMKDVADENLKLHTPEGNEIADKLIYIISSTIDRFTETYEESDHYWNVVMEAEA